MSKEQFSEIILKDREEHKKVVFEGTFLDYIEKLEKDTSIPKLSHARIFEMLNSKGVSTIEEKNDIRLMKLHKNKQLPLFNFFMDDFYGLEETITNIVRYFQSASMKAEQSRQVLYLIGPVGSGKSSIVDKLKKGLEESNPIFAIEGCPMHEEPLHLVPLHLRSEFESRLGVTIEGDLCPICRYRLDDEFNNEYERFPIQLIEFSKNSKIGVAEVPPVDPNNQDTSVLIGSEDISKLDKYSEDDPRVLTLGGAFNRSNRGIIEFIEVFKNAIEFLHVIITATQEKNIPAPGKHGMIYWDGVIVAHSNEAEWNKFKSDHTNEAILDRIVVIKVPYVLSLNEEIKIYQKFMHKSDFKPHIAPHTLEIASKFAILTRLEKTNKCDLLTKLKIYNGEEIIEKGKTKHIDIHELKEDCKREGLFGLSTRFIIKAINNALADNMICNCINPINIRESLVKMVKESDFSDDTKKEYLGFLHDILHKDYLDILEDEIGKAFVYSYHEQAESLFQSYLDHAQAWVNKEKIKDSDTGEELEADENFLKSIEEQIEITGSTADGFRRDVMAYLLTLSRRNEKLSYKSYEPLKKAIEKKLTISVKDISRIVTTSKTRDEEQLKKYNDMVTNLINNGYCDHCVNVILKYAANHLWK
ncbi:MAG: serine protein kinase [Spirochaetota bacterium]|nr:serine protein kinase [Spirochaetota bacterium]